MPPRSRATKPAPKEDETPKFDAGEDSGVRINRVSRDEEGNSCEAPGFRLYIQEGASDEDRIAAWNLNGELPPEEVIAYIPKPQV